MNYLHRFILMALFIVPLTIILGLILNTIKSSHPEYMPTVYLVITLVVIGITGVLGYILYRQQKLLLIIPFILASLSLIFMTISMFLEETSTIYSIATQTAIAIGVAAIASAPITAVIILKR